MIKQKRILQSDIRHACGDTYYSRGKKYFDDGRVINLYIEQEETFYIILSTSIEGSRSNYYDQKIRIDWNKNYTSVAIDGDCSCPMEFNCKHIAAACLKYMNLSAQAMQVADAVPSCLEWLNNFEQVTATFNKKEEFIAYVLKPSKTPHVFTLDLMITKENKKGGLNKGRKTTLNNLRYSYSYTSYIQAVDEEIALLLSSLKHTYQGTPELVGSTGAIALSKILQTGRLFWQSHQSPALHLGDGRSIEFLWRQQENKDYKLKLFINPKATLILTDPPLYLDEQHNILGSIAELNISNEQLEKIVSAPPVPEKHVNEFSQRLTIDFPNIPLPAPKKIEVTDLSNLIPTPKLTLFGLQVNQTQYSHFIQLNFNYDDKAISAYTQDSFAIIKTDQGIFRIQRDIDTESLAFKQLLDFGFTSAELRNHNELVFLSPADGSIINSANRWADFLTDHASEVQ